MSRSTFQKLLLLVEPGLQRNKRMGLLAKRPVVIPEPRLAMCLRMMVGGYKYDIATTYKVAPDTVYCIFHQTRKVLDEKLKFRRIPRTYEGLKQMADDFQTSRSPANPLPGCIGALDGIAIKIKSPAKGKQPASFWCRKGYPSIPVRAMCDSKYRFLCFSATCRGSTHDSLAHAVSALGRYLLEGNLPIAFWIAGDEACVCSFSFITPIPGSQATDKEDAFNFYHSSTRMHIEQAFGMLVRKWAILKSLEYSVGRSAEIIGLAMKLHNFVVDHGGKRLSSSELSDEQRAMIENSEKWYTESREAYAREVREEGMAKRGHLIEIIKRGGFMRPPIRPVRVIQHPGVPTAILQAS